jgi:response regulator of citrate/malate metabolism
MISNSIAYVVEDDEVCQFVLANHLRQKYNFKVKCFSDGESLLSFLDKKPTLVLLDYYLHEEKGTLNGLDVFKIIKNIDPDIKVIFISSLNDLNIFHYMLKNGVRDYIIKNESLLIELDNYLTTFINDGEPVF